MNIKRAVAALSLLSLALLAGCSRPAESIRFEDVQTVTQEEPAEPLPELSREEKLAAVLDGDYPKSIKDAVRRNPETLDFAYQYNTYKGMTFPADLTAEAEGETVPLLLQWDSRWGYGYYGDNVMGLSGCGPTCLSMAAVFLLHDPSLTPESMAAFSVEQGCRVDGVGTSWLLFSSYCRKLGLSSNELQIKEEEIAAALDAGCVVIAALGPGDFTDVGHFIVLRGFCAEGIMVNDPFSIEKSERAWRYEELSPQINALWALSVS